MGILEWGYLDIVLYSNGIVARLAADEFCHWRLHVHAYTPVQTLQVKAIHGTLTRECTIQQKCDRMFSGRNSMSRYGILLLQAHCDPLDPNAGNSYMYAFDFGNSTPSAFSLGLYYNDTNALNNTNQMPPVAQRVNAVRLCSSYPQYELLPLSLSSSWGLPVNLLLFPLGGQLCANFA